MRQIFPHHRLPLFLMAPKNDPFEEGNFCKIKNGVLNKEKKTSNRVRETLAVKIKNEILIYFLMGLVIYMQS